MIRKQEGFTMVELLLTMAIFVLTIAAATNLFVPLLTQFKQQSKTAETQIEGIVGLETLRRDIEQAGFGLPWNIPTGVSYQEASSSPASTYNDSTANPPRAILSGNDIVSNPVIGSSDYLVIKSTIVGTNNAAPKWTYIIGNRTNGCNVRFWKTTDDLNPTDWLVALIPSMGESATSQRILVNNGSVFAAQFGAGGSGATALMKNCIQDDYGSKYLVYGIETDTKLGNLRMPFNRADYYISTGSVPPRCAANTGLLVKSVVSHADGKPGSVIPLMDCVADMEVIYGLDQNNTGTIKYFTDITGLTAQEVRDQVKEVRVYILAHEGQKDITYDSSTGYSTGKVTVGEFGLGNNFDLTQITDWQRYRWRVHTMIVHAKNLL